MSARLGGGGGGPHPAGGRGGAQCGAESAALFPAGEGGAPTEPDADAEARCAAGPASRRPVIAVLAVQGAFIEHERRLRQLGCATVELRQASDLRCGFDGLVLPGGESTAQSKLLRDLGMLDPLRELIAAGLPVLGTCAGLILLAARVEGTGDLRGLDQARAAGRAQVDGLRTLDVTVERNAYGRQLGSFHAQGALVAGGGAGTPDAGTAPLPLTFIRAPRITALGPAVRPLVTLDGQPVAVQQGAQVAAAFHPELDADDRLYCRFLDLVR